VQKERRDGSENDGFWKALGFSKDTEYDSGSVVRVRLICVVLSFVIFTAMGCMVSTMQDYDMSRSVDA
jgi:hypothetical protein